MTDPSATPVAAAAPQDALGGATLVSRPDRLTRAFELYRRTTASRSAIALVVANAIPLLGVLLFGWSLWTILVLYWVENGIVGFWTVPRILLAQGSLTSDMARGARAGVERWARKAEAKGGVDTAERTRLEADLQSAVDAELQAVPTLNALSGGLTSVLRIPMAIFFLFHYGLFWLVHGVFVFALPSFGAFQSVATGLPNLDPETGVPFFPGAGGAIAAQGAFGEIVWPSVILGAIALFISHGASFVLNYLRGGEYLATSPARAMASPYGRVVVLHITILLGAFAIAFIGAPVGALVVFVVAKTMFDLGLHLREHA